MLETRRGSGARRVRPPAVAGLFYPAAADSLRSTVERLLSAARPPLVAPRALVAPHAGYAYSGSIAAIAYATLRTVRERIRRVVLMGPAHRVPLIGVGLPSCDAFHTPLGAVEVDRRAIAEISDHPAVVPAAAAHAPEHSLEVHLPFLQLALDRWLLVPLLVGEVGPVGVAEVIASLWDESTLVVVSTDLSHYHPYETAARLDRQTAEAIVTGQLDRLVPERACGSAALRGLLRASRARGLEIVELGLESSGDTAGDRHRVVGYGAFAVV